MRFCSRIWLRGAPCAQALKLVVVFIVGGTTFQEARLVAELNAAGTATTEEPTSSQAQAYSSPCHCATAALALRGAMPRTSSIAHSTDMSCVASCCITHTEIRSSPMTGKRPVHCIGAETYLVCRQSQNRHRVAQARRARAGRPARASSWAARGSRTPDRSWETFRSSCSTNATREIDQYLSAFDALQPLNLQVAIGTWLRASETCSNLASMALQHCHDRPWLKSGHDRRHCAGRVL